MTTIYDETISHLRRLRNMDPRLARPVEQITRDVNELERQRRALEEELVAGGGNQPNPDTGAEQVSAHILGRSLRATLREMAQSMLTPGGISTLHLPAGDHGSLFLGFAAGDIDWAPNLCRGRTLRLVGPKGAMISGNPAIAIYPAAGNCSELVLEVWGVTVAGPVSILGQLDVAVEFKRGSRLRSTAAALPATGVPL